MDVKRNFDKNKIFIGWWVGIDKICRWNWQSPALSVKGRGATLEVWQEVKGAVRERK
jgi:hypothetical protein